MPTYRIPFLPDTHYHVYNHGNGDDDIFKNDGNYLYFLQKFAEYISPTAHTFAYCLMPNHFHFLLQIKDETALLLFFREQKKERLLSQYDLKERATVEKTLVIDISEQDLPGLLSQQFSNFLNGYTQAFNKQQKRKGSLFLDNIQRKVVDSETYFTTLVHYIHSNPVHHGFVRRIDDWYFSSYLALMDTRKTNLNRKAVLDWFGSVAEYKAVHGQPPKPYSPDFEFD
jgi:putative transposase